ncbi:anthranilate phosphoribosyltransferase [Streptomyces thermolilacinus]|uniref:Anthranilate phosphoribosyltransferase n=1 Tax=Streptomyces thermolilacinus SPC6 TaxID=1306406 RepID=A0A1D3DZW2_9ACTN|nr:anthranilate phosphoribosyltransferase [Streptomyces thermolilacinus]OEJ97862.1 anthranilate phosphoribosyltransferase [Streptomyces thermolilacinus SPC6]
MPVTAEPQVSRSWPELLNALLERRSLSADDTDWAMDEVMSGAAGPVRLAGLLVALRAKGETVEEIEGLVRAMGRHAVPLDVPGPAVDIVGTGGDGSNSVNVSTMSAVVAAGAGARVVKHGNRSASSACGSADVLEELGVALSLPPADVAEVAEETGITFCFAPEFHPAMRHAAGPRRELGVRTVFNALGPLVNPASPAAIALGVADARLAPLLAGVLARRGVSALVFRGDDGMDELTVTTTSTVWSVSGSTVRTEVFDPRDLGMALARPDALRGGDRARNAHVAREVLAGARGPVRDAVLLSAAAGLAALAASDGRPPGSVTERLAAGVERAAESIDSGTAAAVLERWAAVTTKRSQAVAAAG